MWMGELITKRGIGNGISILIFASILTSAPVGIAAWWNGGPMEKLFFPLIALSIVAAVVFIQEGQRRIPIQYAKRMVGPPHDCRRLDLHAAPREHGRRDPGHLRGRRDGLPADHRPVLPQTQDFVNKYFLPTNVPYMLLQAVLIVIFTYFYTAVQFNPVDQADNLRTLRRLHPGHPPRPADRAVPRPRAHPADAPRRDLPGGGCDPADALHPLRRLLAVDGSSARRYLGADRRRRRAGHDAPDGVADDDALLRRLPQIVNVLVLGPQGSGKGRRRSGSPASTTSRTSRPATCSARWTTRPSWGAR